MNYDAIFAGALATLHEEQRYRVSANLDRTCKTASDQRSAARKGK